MSDYTLRITESQKDIDSSNNETNLKDYTISQNFDLHNVSTFKLLTGNVYQSVPFGTVVTAYLVRINSDQPLMVQINGNAGINTVYDMVLRGEVTSLNIKNNSGSTANITVEVFA